MSSYSLRRRPLAPLPLSHFPASPSASSSTLPNTYPAPPSPLSLPLKRSPSTTSLGASPRKVSRGSKDVDVRRTEREIGASERVRRSGSGGVTPRVKKVLERDDLGTGKSPARRLFGVTPERPISGISGAVVTPPTNPHTTYPPRGLLAPSPPIDEPQSYFPDVTASGETEHENGAEVDVHDPGFVVHQDDAAAGSGAGSSSTSVSAPLTPRSRGTPAIALSAPSSPAPSSPLPPLELENQENIPPPSYTHPSSPKSKISFHNSPSKYSTSDVDRYLSAPSTSASASSSTLTLSGGSGLGSGSGTRRRERSKLVNEVLLLRGEVELKRPGTPSRGASQSWEITVEEELTPGRVTRSAKGKAREALVREVEGV
ncbi:hypothetical protein IAT38_007311 [Cryptococcus sp. DSM 104549]